MIPDTRPWLQNNSKLSIILLFNNAFMIRSMIILTVILYSNLSALGFKVKPGLQVIIYSLSLATFWRAWFLRIIPSVCLFANVHGINQQYKLTPKITFHRPLYINRFLYNLEVLKHQWNQIFDSRLIWVFKSFQYTI